MKKRKRPSSFEEKRESKTIDKNAWRLIDIVSNSERNLTKKRQYNGIYKSSLIEIHCERMEINKPN